MKLTGVLIWWSRANHIGVIHHPETDERFFVHLGRIIRGPVVPETDSECLFEIDPHPAAPGKLRGAVAVEIIAKPKVVPAKSGL
jgi:hypothetical protein